MNAAYLALVPVAAMAVVGLSQRGSRSRAGAPRVKASIEHGQLVLTYDGQEQILDLGMGRDPIVRVRRGDILVYAEDDLRPSCSMKRFVWSDRDHAFIEYGDVYFEDWQVEEALGPRKLHLKLDTKIGKLAKYIDDRYY